MNLDLVLLALIVVNFGLTVSLMFFVFALVRRNKDLTKRIYLVDDAMTNNLAISIMNDAQLCKRPWR